jgi:hypothetical protein
MGANSLVKVLGQERGAKFASVSIGDKEVVGWGTVFIFIFSSEV